jgi:PKHD-type hydroxylase
MNSDHIVIHEFLNHDEIDQLIQHAKLAKSEYRTNRGGNTYCTVAWIRYNHPGFQALSSRIDEIVAQQNAQLFHFENIAPFTGQYQYTDYHEPGDAYGWHTDYGTNPEYLALRRLTITIALSDASEYEGGGFELSDHWGHSTEGNPGPIYESMLSLNDDERLLLRQKGTLAMFPANRMHKALPVLSGSRKVLVCWISATS